MTTHAHFVWLAFYLFRANWKQSQSVLELYGTWTDPIHLIRWEIDNMRMGSDSIKHNLSVLLFLIGKSLLSVKFYLKKKNSPSLK